MKLQVGKRYVRRNESITSPLLGNGHVFYPWKCDEFSYTEDGNVHRWVDNPLDLVAEYEESGVGTLIEQGLRDAITHFENPDPRDAEIKRQLIMQYLFAKRAYYAPNHPEIDSKSDPMSDVRFDSIEDVIKRNYPGHPCLRLVGWEDSYLQFLPE